MSDQSRPRLGARTLVVGAAVVVVLAGLKAAQSLIIPFLLALFLAIICFPAVSWMTSKRVPVGLAVLVGRGRAACGVLGVRGDCRRFGQ